VTLAVGNCNIRAKQKFLVMNETKWYKIWMYNFIQFCNLSLLLLRFLKVFGKILVSFRLFQILEISDLGMAKDKKVNVAVT
jgi:hypothetical protein